MQAATGLAARKQTAYAIGHVKNARAPLAVKCALGVSSLSRSKAYAKRHSRTHTTKVVAFLEGCKVDPTVSTPYSELAIGRLRWQLGSWAVGGTDLYYKRGFTP